MVEKEASQGSDSGSSEKPHGIGNQDDAGFGYELPGGLGGFYNLIAAATAAAAQTGETLTSEQLRATVAKTLRPETKKADNTAEIAYPLAATGELEDFGASISFDEKPGSGGWFSKLYLNKPTQATASVNAGDYRLYVGGHQINLAFLELFKSMKLVKKQPGCEAEGLIKRSSRTCIIVY